LKSGFIQVTKIGIPKTFQIPVTLKLIAPQEVNVIINNKKLYDFPFSIFENKKSYE
jgi:hypothetical protein